MTTRCKFCGHKLNDKGCCENTNCPESLRAKLNEEAENKTRNNG